MRNGSWFRQSNLKFMEVLLLTYYMVRRVPAYTIQQEHQFDSAVLSDWLNLCRDATLDYVLGNHGLKRHTSPPSRSCRYVRARLDGSPRLINAVESMKLSSTAERCCLHSSTKVNESEIPKWRQMNFCGKVLL